MDKLVATLDWVRRQLVWPLREIASKMLELCAWHDGCRFLKLDLEYTVPVRTPGEVELLAVFRNEEVGVNEVVVNPFWIGMLWKRQDAMIRPGVGLHGRGTRNVDIGIVVGSKCGGLVVQVIQIANSMDVRRLEML